MAKSSAKYFEVRWRTQGADEAWSAPQRIDPSKEVVVEGLDRTKSYDFEVRAVSNCGAMSIWVPSDYTVPTVPPLPAVNIPVGSGVADGVQLDWGDGTSTRADLQYEISRAPATGEYVDAPPPPGHASWKRVAIVSGTTWVDAVTDTASYWYRLRTVDYRGNVGEWTVISSPPAASISTSELASTVIAEFAAVQDDIEAVQAQADALRGDVDGTIAAVAQEVADRTAAIDDEANARATALLNEENAREAAISTESTLRQSADESLAVALSQVSAGTGEQFDPAKIWYFDTTAQDWMGKGAPTIVDGWLRPADQSSDPWVASPTGLALVGQSYRFVKLRIKRVGAPVWDGQLFWRLPTDGTAFTVAQSAAIPEPSFDAAGITTISWQDIAWWPGTIDQIRVDLSAAQTATDYFLIDWIAIGRPTPGAGVAALQDETAARVTADAAEATQRTTLATQMRGTYTGTDVAQVASGLLYSERQARSSADSAMATDISSMQARLPAGSGKLATEASVTTEATARASADNALATRTGAMEARMPLGTGSLATAASVSTEESARTTADSAMAADIALLGAHNAGKNAFNLRSDTVRIDGGQTLAQTISGLQAADSALSTRVDNEQTARIDGDAANAASFSALQVTLGADRLIIPDASFEDASLAHWQIVQAGWDNQGPAYSGARAVRVQPSDMLTSQEIRTAANVPVVGGERIRLRARFRPTGSAPTGTIRFTMRTYDAAGAQLAYSGVGSLTHQDTDGVGTYVSYDADYVLPVGAVKARIGVQALNLTSGSWTVDDIEAIRLSNGIGSAVLANASAIQANDVAIGVVDGKATANASSISTLSTTVSGHTTTLTSYGNSIDGIKAKAGVVADANGRITGWQLLAGGTVSSFTVMADNFSVAASSSTNYMSWSGGANGLLQMVSTSSGGVLRMGGGFGSGSDKLIFGYTAANVGDTASQTLAKQKVGFTASGRYKFGSTWGGLISGWSSGGAISYTSTSTSATINVASGVFRVGDQSISYNASSISFNNPSGATRTYYLYYDDPGMTGGSLTLNADTNPVRQYDGDGRVVIGQLAVTFKSGGGGGSNPVCPVRNAYVWRRRGTEIRWVRAKRVRPGDWLRVIDPATGDLRWGLVTYSRSVPTECVTVATDAGVTLTCSRTAPLGTPDGEVLSIDAEGRTVSGYAGGFVTPKVTAVTATGRQWVQHITCENTFFLAGDKPGEGLAHHNLKPIRDL